MEYGRIPGIDKPVSRLAQGTIMVSSERLDESFALLDGVFELGCTMFDTAHIYGGGDNERTVGRWVNRRGIREKVVIIGKGAHHVPDRKRVTPADIAADLGESLERFGFDYIDLYLLHRDDPDAEVGPVVEALNEHLRAGSIRAFGGSNWTCERIAAANDYAAANGLVGFVASSPNFSLAVQRQQPWEGCVSISGPGHPSRRWYRQSQLALIPWSSLGGGFFSGRFTRDNLDTFESYFDNVCVQCYCSEENFRRLDRARELAARKNVTAAQIAMAYVLNQPLNVFPLVGCQTAQEFRANAEALKLRLTEEEMDWLER